MTDRADRRVRETFVRFVDGKPMAVTYRLLDGQEVSVPIFSHTVPPDAEALQEPIQDQEAPLDPPPLGTRR